MTGNKSYLSDYEEIDGGFVAFRGDPKGGKITGKGKISTGKLDFEDVYFVKELKFNLFSVSQMCDKKNSVLFTDTECVVLSPDFKLLDENHVLLRVPRKDNMYSVDLKNIVPSGATKDETSEILKTFITGIENLIDLKVKVIRCDNGTEFKNKVMNQFCEIKGIKREFSVARTLQQNGVAERKNRTLIEAARTMLDDSKLLTTFWVEAVNNACYVQNRVLVIKPHNKTPYELFLSRKPALSFMRPFGCPVTILSTLDHLGKLDGKADEGFFVGYSTNSKVYRVFNSRTRIVEENMHVKFSEETPNIAGNGPNWLFDIDALTISMNYKPIVAGNQTNDNAGTKENINAGQDEKKIVPDQNKVPNIKEPRVNQEQDANVNNTNNINTVSLTVNASDIENNIVDENIVYGCIDDPNMPNLEEIVYSDDDEEVGAEADMNNLATTVPVIEPKKVTQALTDISWIEAMHDELLQFKLRKDWTLVELPYGKRSIAQGYTQEEGINYDEVFARVARIEAIRLFLAYASFMNFIVYQMDVKSAFLYGTIEEEVYVCQPSGFEDLEFPNKVYKENGFRRGTIDKTLFIKNDKDDILLVKQKDDGNFISQDKYVADIFKKFDFATVKTASTPMETNKALLKDEEAVDVDVHLYRSMTGSLMYLTSSRPDIMFAVCVCARFQYPKDSPFDLEAFSDSDYAGASLDRKSTIGGCQFLGRRLISWQCKKQTIVANSTTEAYTICIVKNPMYHSKTKHIEIRHHFIRDSYEKRLIQVIKIHTDHNVADLLAKAFDWEDIMERAATTASSLEAEQDNGNINRTHSMAILNESFPQGTDSSNGPRCQDTILGGAEA
ncbi:putative ribonuclease H-like domain-containing protein [Tanacetum coccineum]|uniref:Ribonuclease H-like domain-containing protein n=1 Tax=Tanacetum coccineum TaxID=301880 RepID=A0ABQ5DKJ1_9ASTR